MNERFVCVKVDREQRPDIDDVYMAATQIMTGRGGWPMSVFVEPDTRAPFYCGTYFPPRPGHGLPSFGQVLMGMSGAFTEQREDVRSQARAVADAVRAQLAPAGEPVVIGPGEVQSCVGTLLATADDQNGGFGPAPKFPQPASLAMLMAVRDAADEATRAAVDRAVTRTLDAMMLGGIHDHAGGGFHRYSVDATWTVPHFEKMLYDNAGLLALYARAARVYRDAQYARTAARTAEYVIREMLLPGGGFAAAQDAEVNGREGLNYLWTPDEAAACCRDQPMLDLLGLSGPPNFRDPHHPSGPARHVLRLAERIDTSAQRLSMPVHDLAASLDQALDALRDARRVRPAPRLDDTAITAWNGMMACALCEASPALARPDLIDYAEAAVRGILARCVGGIPPRSVRGDSVSGPGVLEDSAWLIAACAALGAARRSQGREHAEWAVIAAGLTDAAERVFGGPAGYHDTPADARGLLVRARTTYDGATVSGISAMINALLDTADLSGDPAYDRRAIDALAAISGAVSDAPLAAVNSTRALFRLLTRGVSVESELNQRGAAARPARGLQPAAAGVVEVYCDAERVTVAEDRPGALTLVARIAEGFHIIAADPGPGGKNLVALRLGIVGGSGVAAYAEYPRGEPYALDDTDHPVLVHTGEIELKVVLERAGDLTGRPILVLSYQACSDRECLRPAAVELDVAIDAD
jgi:uncharacterized protein YyaL (SSP411 family)